MPKGIDDLLQDVHRVAHVEDRAKVMGVLKTDLEVGEGFFAPALAPLLERLSGSTVLKRTAAGRKTHVGGGEHEGRQGDWRQLRGEGGADDLHACK